MRTFRATKVGWTALLVMVVGGALNSATAAEPWLSSTRPSAEPASSIVAFRAATSAASGTAVSPASDKSVAAFSKPTDANLVLKVAPPWQMFARSTTGLPLEAVRFGYGAKQVLVVGSLFGDEPEGVALAEALAEYLVENLRRLNDADVRVTIVRNPNPDGSARRTAANARGVALDRNFRTANWRRSARGDQLASGEAADSEPETRALLELLDELQPDRVLLLGASTSKTKRPTVAYAGPAEDLARQLTLEAEGQLVVHEASLSPGAWLTLTGSDRQIPSIYLGCVPRATKAELWADQRRTLMTAIGVGSPVPFVARPKKSATASKIALNVSPTGGATAAAVDPFQQTTSPALPAAPAVPVSNGDSDEAAAVIRFQTIEAGRPLVKIAIPRQASEPFNAAMAGHSGGGSAMAPASRAMRPIPTIDRSTSAVMSPAKPIPALDRLPPADRIQPALGSGGASPPPAAYPSTGVN